MRCNRTSPLDGGMTRKPREKLINQSQATQPVIRTSWADDIDSCATCKADLACVQSLCQCVDRTVDFAGTGHSLCNPPLHISSAHIGVVKPMHVSANNFHLMAFFEATNLPACKGHKEVSQRQRGLQRQQRSERLRPLLWNFPKKIILHLDIVAQGGAA